VLLRYFKLGHDLAISLIVGNCWSLGQERITLQIGISENSVRLEIFRYSNLWHEFAIAHKPISFSTRKLRI